MLAAFWQNPSLMRSLSSMLSTAAFVAFAAGGLYWLAHRAVFSIRVIEIEAETGGEAGARPGSDGGIGRTSNKSFPTGLLRHVNVPTVRAAALPRIFNATRLNFFTVNLETIRQAFENVAWVRHARVTRVWPNRLRVAIEEHQVLGTWDGGSEREGGAFVNTRGELFAVNPAEAEDDAGDEGLPGLSGPPGSEKTVAARFADFSAWFAGLGLKPDQVDLSSRYAWSLHLLRVGNGTDALHARGEGDGAALDVNPSAPDPGLSVELGKEIDASTLAKRVARMLAAYPLITAKWPKPTSVDLRYPNGFALRAEGLRLTDPATKKGVPKKSASPAAIRSNSRDNGRPQVLR